MKKRHKVLGIILFLVNIIWIAFSIFVEDYLWGVVSLLLFYAISMVYISLFDSF